MPKQVRHDACHPELVSVSKLKKTYAIIYDVKAFCKSLYLEQPPFCPSDILPPKGAGRDCGATISLAPFGGKGLRVRGLK
jgi:hypothetical protein